jgi:hypothetical protein
MRGTGEPGGEVRGRGAGREGGKERVLHEQGPGMCQRVAQTSAHLVAFKRRSYPSVILNRHWTTTLRDHCNIFLLPENGKMLERGF